MLQTVSTSSRDSEGSLTFFSAVSFCSESSKDFSQALSGLKASAQDVSIHQSKRLSKKQKESLLLFFQSSEPALFQETLKT